MNSLDNALIDTTRHSDTHVCIGRRPLQGCLNLRNKLPRLGI